MSPSSGRSASTTAWLVSATMVVTVMMIGLDRMVLNVALPKMTEDFGVDTDTVAWLATGYILADAVFVPTAAKLADIMGNRRVLIWAVVGFLVTSVLCALAWSFETLLVSRILQGLFGAAVYPTTLTIITRTVFASTSQRNAAIGIWSAAMGVSAILGPLAGGPLIDLFSWRAIFWMNVPVSLLALVLTLLLLPRERWTLGGIRSLDWWGTALLTVALTAFVLVVEKGEDWGWTSSGALFLYAVTVAAGIAFYRYELDHPDPVVDPKLLGNTALVVSLGVTFVSFGGLMGAMYLIPTFAQVWMSYSSTRTGFLLAPMAISMVAVTPISVYLQARLATSRVVAISMVIAAGGMFLLSGLDARTGAWDVVLPLMVMSAGLGIGLGPLTTAATDAVERSQVSTASGLVSLTRNLAGAVCVAVFGTIYNGSTENNVISLAGGSTVNDPAAAATGAQMLVTKASIDAFGDVFLVAAGMLLVAAAAAMFLRRAPGGGEGAPAETLLPAH